MTASKAEFHTYTPIENKKPKIVLKGLPPNISSDEILSSLILQNVSVLKVSQYTKKLGDKLQLVCLSY